MSTADFWVDAADGRPAQVKALGTPVVNLTNNGVAGVTRLWTVVDAPPGTTAVLSSATGPAPTYGPLDQAGTYMLRLAVDGAVGPWETDAQVDEIVIRVRTAAVGVVIPAIGETTQGGTEGWADWLTGMNEALGLLASAQTLQGIYDGSAPPTISTASASPLALYRASATATPIFRAGDATKSDRLELQSDGRLALTADIDQAADIVLDVVASPASHASARLLRLLDTTSGAGLSFGSQGQFSIYSVGASANGPFFETVSPSSHLLSAEDTGAANPTNFSVLPDGGIKSWSDTPAYGLDLDTLTPSSGLFRVRNSAGSGGSPLSFTIDKTGGITAYSKAASPAGLAVLAPSTTGFICLFQDVVGGGLWRINGAGEIEHSAPLGAADTAMKIIPSLIHEDSTIIEVSDGALSGWALYGDGAIFHMPEELISNAAASIAWYGMDLTRMGSVANGETRRGFFVDGSAASVVAGGTLVGFDSQVEGNLGEAACFRAVVDDQDAVKAYACEDTAGDPLVAFDRFCLADLGHHEWTGGISINRADAGSVSTITAGNPSLYLIFPVHVPHGAQITNFSVHVNAGGAGIQAFLMRTQATAGGDAAVQTLVGATAAALAAASQDLTTSGFFEDVPLGGAGKQYAYSIVVESGHANDVFHSGHVEYTYDQLTPGD